MGGPGSGRGRQRRNLTRELQCVRLRAQGLTLTEVGRRLDITAASVANALRRQGRPDLLGVSGFAGIDPERQREIAPMGGKAAHAAGTAHQFSSEEARAAGSKGGTAAHRRGTAHTFTPEQAQAAGRKGRRAPKRGRRKHKAAPSPHTTSAAGPTRQRAGGRRHGRLPDVARVAEMARLRTDGLTYAEIGRRLGVSRQAVYDALRRALQTGRAE
jgi:DNA-binding CsgD family transcriptional regulator